VSNSLVGACRALACLGAGGGPASSLARDVVWGPSALGTDRADAPTEHKGRQQIPPPPPPPPPSAAAPPTASPASRCGRSRSATGDENVGDRRQGRSENQEPREPSSVAESEQEPSFRELGLDRTDSVDPISILLGPTRRAVFDRLLERTREESAPSLPRQLSLHEQTRGRSPRPLESPSSPARRRPRRSPGEKKPDMVANADSRGSALYEILRSLVQSTLTRACVNGTRHRATV
jgi:hypothetical protein